MPPLSELKQNDRSVFAVDTVGPASSANPPVPIGPPHLTYLDGLRALAALYVMFGHAALEVWPVYTTGRYPGGLAGYVFTCFSFGHFAVSVFIVLSGFCLMLPVLKDEGLLKGGALQFFRKRAHRILPPYYFALALSLGLIWMLIGEKTGTHWDSSLPVTVKGVTAHVLLLQDIYASAQINHVFWSIAVEWQIYFLFPLLVLLWRRLGGGWTTLGTVLVSLVGLHLLRHSDLAGITPQFIGLFAIGMFGATIAYTEDKQWRQWRERLPWPILFVVVATVAGFLIHSHKEWYADYFVGLAAVSVTVSISRNPASRLRAFLSTRPMVFIGAFAYSLYLVHAPLLQIVWQYALHPLHLGDLATFCLLLGFGCPMIVGAAYLFFLACERPFLTKGSEEIRIGGFAQKKDGRHSASVFLANGLDVSSFD